MYDKMEGTFKMIGAMIGFVLGVRFEAKKVNFVNHRILWKNLIRFVFGVAVVMGVRYRSESRSSDSASSTGKNCLPERKSRPPSPSCSAASATSRWSIIAIGIYPMAFRKPSSERGESSHESVQRDAV
ncbi:MAG: hypothetical protein MZU97_11070 [Bacillus subtilis]|nr:hypothetical protein [Bacillus subtilis]